MSEADARAYLISVLRKRMQHPNFDRVRFCAGIEGAGGPDEPGWMVRGGWMVTPGHFAEGAHRFRLADLFVEIDSPQGVLII